MQHVIQKEYKIKNPIFPPTTTKSFIMNSCRWLFILLSSTHRQWHRFIHIWPTQSFSLSLCSFCLEGRNFLFAISSNKSSIFIIINYRRKRKMFFFLRLYLCFGKHNEKKRAFLSIKQEWGRKVFFIFYVYV